MSANWVLPALVTLVCWGLWGFIPKLTTQYINPMSAMIYETIGAAIVGLVVLTLVDFRPEVHVKGVCLGITTGIIGLTGALGFLFAVKSGKVAVVAMFTSMSPIITVALGCLVLKEPVTFKEGLGILSAFAAIFFFAS
ncbi:EamA family transporter [Desulfoluna spongiiphila]|uniref:Transporter family protein n=1 Tax=Desulfoluna spongiiphila TaxID=419481 RepID=A0A1G5BHU7_9BACT|nr:DMT family transporter [Desulfoluna spongiiphila]SCX89678.1 transporter family protein [Desulfoluna spongiiphila]VVS93747.1 eama domain [Desulfoluna spongiiphila]